MQTFDPVTTGISSKNGPKLSIFRHIIHTQNHQLNFRFLSYFSECVFESVFECKLSLITVTFCELVLRRFWHTFKVKICHLKKNSIEHSSYDVKFHIQVVLFFEKLKNLHLSQTSLIRPFIKTKKIEEKLLCVSKIFTFTFRNY